MRFEFYHSGLDAVPKLSVDGTVGNSIHFSHWQGNQTPVKLKADTSTEIALNLVASPNPHQFTRGIELVTNNHFDTDGVLSVWTVLNGERALDFRELLIGAATAGDFSEFTTPQAMRANIVIQGGDQPVPEDDPGSPIASQLAGHKIDDEARAYDLVLPEVESILKRTDAYEPLWRNAWNRIETSIESFERGASRVVECENAVSLVTLAAELFSPAGFNPAQHAPPYTAISRYAKGELFLIATPLNGGWAYRIDYPYYSWAETVVRRLITRRDFLRFLMELNRIETGDGEWRLNNDEMTSAVKFLGSDGVLAASFLPPERVCETLRVTTVAPALDAAHV